jgi:hypothetical protein
MYKPFFYDRMPTKIRRVRWGPHRDGLIYRIPNKLITRKKILYAYFPEVSVYDQLLYWINSGYTIINNKEKANFYRPPSWLLEISEKDLVYHGTIIDGPFNFDESSRYSHDYIAFRDKFPADVYEIKNRLGYVLVMADSEFNHNFFYMNFYLNPLKANPREPNDNVYW